MYDIQIFHEKSVIFLINLSMDNYIIFFIIYLNTGLNILSVAQRILYDIDLFALENHINQVKNKEVFCYFYKNVNIITISTNNYLSFLIKFSKSIFCSAGVNETSRSLMPQRPGFTPKTRLCPNYQA